MTFDFHKVRSCLKYLSKTQRPSFLELVYHMVSSFKNRQDCWELYKEAHRVIKLAIKSGEIKYDKNNRLKIPTMRERINMTKNLFKTQE